MCEGEQVEETAGTVGRGVRKSEVGLATGKEMSHVDVYDCDDAAATAIFYHGNITFATFYHNFLEELAARGIRALAPDRIGMGRSSGKPGSFTVADLWNQANAVMEYVADRYEPPFLAIGHSVGGTLALEHFLAEPRLAACVANNIRHPASEKVGLREKVELALFRAGAKMLPRVQLDTLGLVEGEAAAMCEPDRVCLRRIMAADGSDHTAKDFTIGSLAAYIKFRAPGDHAEVARPLLVLIGDRDTEQEMILAQEAVDAIEGPVTLEVVEGAGHFVLETDYERAADKIVEWLEACAL